jgi:membrane dipeptidase
MANADTKELERIHSEAYPIDTHLDSLYITRLGAYDFWKGDWKPGRDPLSFKLLRAITPKGRNKPLCEHVSGPDFLKGGYGGACFSAHALWENLIPPLLLDPWRNWIEHRDYLHKIIDESHGQLKLTSTPEEVESAKAAGVRSAILSLEGAHILGPYGARSQALRMTRLEETARDGAAYITLNHFSNTDISEAGYQPMNAWRRIKGGGLSDFGQEFVERCIDLGLMIDVSHTCNKAILDVAVICKNRGVPLLASHAASRTVTLGENRHTSPHLDRGFTDEAIRAIVDTGGTISIILSPSLLQTSRLPDGKPNRDADLAFVVDYYERFANLIAGMNITPDPWDHLSFGSDFDGGISSIPIGIESGADLPNFTQAMLEAGWPKDRIIRVYSGNFLRVWRAARFRRYQAGRAPAAKPEPFLES